MKLLDGKIVRDAHSKKLKEYFQALATPAQLAVIQIGKREDSTLYIEQKKKFAASLGVEVKHSVLPENIENKKVFELISICNNDPLIHGIIIQLPLPEHLSDVNTCNTIIDSIAPEKDIDGLTAVSIKRLWTGNQTGFIPATAKGISSLLKYYDIPVESKHVVVVGRSLLVGKSIAGLLLGSDATVTITHSKTVNLSTITRTADIIIAGAGKPGLITEEYVKKGAVIIDVGTTIVGSEKLLKGDVDISSVEHTAGAVSPVPGGVGPMTVISLFENLKTAHQNNFKV